jgi:hypothetical protein
MTTSPMPPRARTMPHRGGSTLDVNITAPAQSVQQRLDGAAKVKAIEAVEVTPTPTRSGPTTTEPEVGEGKPIEARRSRAKA